MTISFSFLKDAINAYREQQRLNKCRNNEVSAATKPTNAIIYIKDPNNKSSDVQYVSLLTKLLIILNIIKKNLRTDGCLC